MKPSPLSTRLAACLALLAGIAPAAAEEPGLHAGAAAVDITPEHWPLSPRGSFTPRPVEGVHDPLHARAVALRSGEGRAVIAIIDNLMIDRETLDGIKARAAEATGWSPAEMLVACTHTHSAPSVSATGDGPAGLYGQKARDGIVQAITEAVARLEPAAAGWGVDAVPDEVSNRRWFLEEGTMPPNPFGELDQVRMNPNRAHITRPAGPVDPEVRVLDIRARRGGRPLAFLGNYALHYVGGVPGGQMSADYFGEYCRVMPARLGGGTPETFVAMLSNGASGDINNIDFAGSRPPRAPFEQIRLVAAKVADASWRAARDLTRDPEAPVAILEREVELERRKPSPERLERAQTILAMSEDEAAKLPNLAVNYARSTIRAHERPATEMVLVQALRVGELGIVTLPFEVLVEIGLEIKEKSPFPHTMLIELANGAYGYLPTPGQHALGGYETWLGTSSMQEDASDILTRHLLEMLAELRGG